MKIRTQALLRRVLPILLFALMAAALMPMQAFAGAVVVPDGTITGTVTDSGSHTLVGATVSLHDSGYNFVDSTTTNASGVYSFTGLGAGGYNVRAESSFGLWSPFATVTLPASPGVLQNLVVPMPELTGHVTAGGASASDVEVRLYQKSGSDYSFVVATHTDASGDYAFGGRDDGDYYVGFLGGQLDGTYYDPMYWDGAVSLNDAKSVTLSDGTTASGHDFSLVAAMPSVTGTVRDASGAPLGGVDVTSYVEESGNWVSADGTTTASDGTYAIYGLGVGTRRVGIGMTTDGPIAYPAAFFGGGSDVNLATSFSTAYKSTASNKDIARSATGETLAADAYEVDNVYTQAKRLIPGAAATQHTIFGLGDSDWAYMDVTAGKQYTIETSTSASYPTWNTMSDTYLRLYGPDGTTLITYNDDGNDNHYSRIVWTAPTTERVYLQVQDYGTATGDIPGFAAYKLMASEAVNSDTGSVSGHVTDDATHDGIAGLQVTLNDTVDDIAVAYTAADGSYTFAGLPAGDYAVSIQDAPGYDLSSVAGANVTIVAPGDAATADFSVPADTSATTGEVYGYVGDTHGSAIQSATVTLARSGVTTSTESDSHGYFDLVPNPGTYTMTVTKAGHRTATYSGVVVVRGGSSPHNAILAAFFTLNSSAGAGGTISASQTVDWGADSAAFTITPNAGYFIGNVVVDGVSKGAIGSYTFTGVKADHTISAAFSLTPPKALSISRGPSKASVLVKRKKKVAKFTLSARLKDSSGYVAGAVVYLQTSKNGKSGWKTSGKALVTNGSGLASRAFSTRKSSTVYYRWYAPATMAHFASTTSKQRVMVK